MKIYLSGSLRNPRIPAIANTIQHGLTDSRWPSQIKVWADWFGAGKIADDEWEAYEKSRGRTYEQALYGDAARNIFAFDRNHLDSSDAFILVMPAGKSSCIELGYMVGRGRPAWVFFEGQPERWDQMFQFATRVHFNMDSLLDEIRETL